MPKPSARRDIDLLGSLVYRPAIYRRNGVAWLAACAWRSAAKADDIDALKGPKREMNEALAAESAALIGGLLRQLYGTGPAAGVTCIPCGHSRRPDCFGKRLAIAVAQALGLPFRQVFSDRFCSGVSHPKELGKLPQLRQIANPMPSMLDHPRPRHLGMARPRSRS